MLASTGMASISRVSCLVCGQAEWEFEIYTPEIVRERGPLDLSLAIKGKVVFDPESKLFEIRKKPDGWPEDMPLNVWESKLDRSLYDDGYLLPRFGYYVGHTVWVCATCVRKAIEESTSLNRMLDRVIGEKIFDKIQDDYSYVAGVLFTYGCLTLKRKRHKSVRSLHPNVKAEIKPRVEKLYETLPHINPSFFEPLVVQNIRQLYKLINDKQVK